MPPPPMMPTRMGWSGPGEGTIHPFDVRGRGRAVEERDAMAERDRRTRRDRDVQLLLAFGEDLFTHRIGGKEPVAAGVPVGREARVARVVEHRDRHGFPV